MVGFKDVYSLGQLFRRFLMLLAFRKMGEITGLLPLSAGFIGCGKALLPPTALQQDANKPGKKRIT